MPWETEVLKLPRWYRSPLPPARIDHLYSEIPLLDEKRGVQKKFEYVTTNRVMLVYELALQRPELVSPAFDAYGVDEFTAPPYAAVRQAIATTARPRHISANSAGASSWLLASAAKRSRPSRIVNCGSPGMSSLCPPFTTTDEELRGIVSAAVEALDTVATATPIPELAVTR